MSLLRLAGVSCYYGADHIFGPVDLAVNPGDHIGLIGPNGSGKSSLLEILAGRSPEEGRVARAKELVVGYLRQESADRTAATVFEYVASAFDALRRQEEELRTLEQRMAESGLSEDALESLMSTYSAKLSAFEEQGGYEQEARARGALFGLGFSESELDRAYLSLSGGERARAQLARLLLTQADLLLLDEPTNHLDLTSTEWLQAFLGRDPRAFIVVSHDRRLLDAVTQRTWEIEARTIHAYTGNYTVSRRQAAERRERLLKEYERDQLERERLEAFVRKWSAGTRAAQAKSRARKLERMEEVAPPPPDSPKAHFTVPVGVQSERRVCTLDTVGVGYDGKAILSNVTLEVRRGARIGIAGANGAGKSTLLRTIAGDLPPVSGLVDVGRGVRSAYFAQHRIDLDPNQSVLEEALAEKRQQIGEARSFLARFLFRGDDVAKQVGVLSGGEKSRLALAKLLLHGGNLLLLDEPTNHLDIDMAEALEEALGEYQGTLLFVTHDRALLAALASSIWWVQDGEVTVIDGGYDALQSWLQSREGEHGQASASTKRTASAGSRTPQEDEERARRRQLRETQTRIAELETEIDELSLRKESLEKALADPASYREGDEARALTVEHKEIVSALNEREGEWEELVELLGQLDPA